MAAAPMVLLHGFTQNHRCLGPLPSRLRGGRDVWTPDLPGHGTQGERGRDSVPMAATGLVDALPDGLRHPPGPPHWFGYSMGGRVALRVAIDHPGAVRSLLLVGVTAGIRDPRERSERLHLDEERARHLESVGVATFCAEWLAAPMFAGLPDWARYVAEREANTVEGIAGSLRNAGTGSMEPMWDELAGIEVPVLLLSGERDEKFSGLAAEMAEAIGSNARAVQVPAAGHAAHLEKPDAVTELVTDFLEQVEHTG